VPIRLEPVVSFAYLYPPGVQIVEHVTPYEAIATILWDSPRRATVRGLHGRMTRAHRDEIENALREAGVEVVGVERHGRDLEWPVRGHVEAGGTGGDSGPRD